MARAFKCDQGHSYVTDDVGTPDDWVDEVPACPECRAQWLAEHQIKDLQRVRLEPGDTLVVRLHSRQPPEAQKQLGVALRAAFPDNKVVVFHSDMDLFVVEQSG